EQEVAMKFAISGQDVVDGRGDHDQGLIDRLKGRILGLKPGDVASQPRGKPSPKRDVRGVAGLPLGPLVFDVSFVDCPVKTWIELPGGEIQIADDVVAGASAGGRYVPYIHDGRHPTRGNPLIGEGKFCLRVLVRQLS